MRRTSLARQKQKRRLEEQYADCHGIPFSEYRFHLPAKVSDWPSVVRVQDDTVEQKMHEWFGKCWKCLADPEVDKYENGVWFSTKIETHHICAGTVGRSDEYANIAVLCNSCHAYANTAKLPFQRIIYLKWKFDRAHCDWIRLAQLSRKFLGSLITDHGTVEDC